MLSPLIRKLELGARLSDEDRAAITRALAETRQIGPRTELVGQGERPDYVHVVLSGYACRYKLLRDGRRQNVALLVPGDICDVHAHVLDAMDHSIATVSACEVALLSRWAVDKLITGRPAIARALWWANLVDKGTLCEWLLSRGQRPALAQMAHLFCELRVRLDSVGLVEADSYDFPLRQPELADVLGTSAVHVNRTLQELRGAGLITLRRGRLEILDLPGLEKLAEFDPSYLHLQRREMQFNSHFAINEREVHV